MRRIALACLASCALGGPLAAWQSPAPSRPPAAGSVRAQLIGNWKLVSYVVFDQDGAPRPGNYDVGRIVYDVSGEMSAHLMTSTRGTVSPATDAARSDAYRTYLAYFGPFIVDEAKGTVTHHVVGSSYPHWLGSAQVRYYAFSGDGRRLTLSVRNGDRVTGSLAWDRVE